MDSYAPSYLFKNRFGIYYFRVRIPKEVRIQLNLKKTEIRKSLGTSNKKEAIRLARIWWVKMENNEFNSAMAGIDDVENDIAEHTRLLKIGRKLLNDLNKLEAKPDHIYSDTDEFEEFLSPSERKALHVARVYFSQQSAIKPDNEEDRISKLNISNNPSNIIFNEESLPKSENFSTLKLSQIYEDYVSSKTREWGETTRRKSRSVFNQFIEIVGDKACSDLTQKDIVEFKTIYLKLPKRTDLGIYKGMSCRNIAAMDIPESKLQVHNTLVNKLSMLLSFLDACENDFHINIDHRKPFKTYSKKTNKKGSGSKARIPYIPGDLTKLFESEEYIKGTHETDARHWVPLIALFTGARLNEICQLYKSDIKESNGIWYFDFNEDREDKSSKTDAGIRFVPIHPQLKKLGLLKYWKSVSDDNRLFPTLKKTQNGYGDSISKWFGRYKKKCDIIIPSGKMLDFHSFRNTLIDNLKQKDVPLESAREIVGHESESLTYGGYANAIDLPNRKKMIDKVNYPSIDFSKIRERRW